MGVSATVAGNGTGFEYGKVMRRLGWIVSILGLTLGGCASQTSSVVPVQQPVVYSAENASALAFDPPVLAGTPRLDLSRDGRGPSAFEGFDEGSTTYYFLQTSDYYSDFGGGRFGRGGNPDYYQRNAVSETYGISYH